MEANNALYLLQTGHTEGGVEGERESKMGHERVGGREQGDQGPTGGAVVERQEEIAVYTGNKRIRSGSILNLHLTDLEDEVRKGEGRRNEKRA